MSQLQEQLKVMWVIGALERLATLGLVNSDIPMKVSQDGLDMYLEADEMRDSLFVNDSEIATIFCGLSNHKNIAETKPENVSDMIVLLLEYKNHREDVVKYALSQQFS